jgi:hypothetical protein
MKDIHKYLQETSQNKYWKNIGLVSMLMASAHCPPDKQEIPA